MSYVIEEGIPCPTTAKGGNWKGPKTEWTRVLDSLRPGQSVLTQDYTEFKAADVFRQRSPDRKFAIRKIAREGWRVWRTE